MGVSATRALLLWDRVWRDVSPARLFLPRWYISYMASVRAP